MREEGERARRRRRSRVPICGWVDIDIPVSFLCGLESGLYSLYLR